MLVRALQPLNAELQIVMHAGKTAVFNAERDIKALLGMAVHFAKLINDRFEHPVNIPE